MSELVEKVAEMPDLPTRTVQLTGITKSERPDIQFEPAPDAAPAVCEWTPRRAGSELHDTACGKAIWRCDEHAGICLNCKAPIKFTEAK